MHASSNCRRAFTISLLCAALTSAGCLSSTHKISRSELNRLAQTNPDTRAERVKVVQGFAMTAEDPPEAPHVHSHTVVVVDSPVQVRHRARPYPKPSRGVHIGKPTSVKAAKKASTDAAALLIAAGAIGVGLAATEGARFNGWVNLHPMHPVHLYGPNGEYTWVPLAQLDPDTAAWASKAFVRSEEGPWQTLERTPLNRRGWNYSMLLGTGEIDNGLDAGRGFLGRIQVGYFPVHEVGVLADLGLGWRDDSQGETIYESRLALELQAFPLQAGRFHGGLFGQGGVSNLSSDSTGTASESQLLGGGGIFQYDLTTYLALTARAGVTYAHDQTSSELTLGLSIY